MSHDEHDVCRSLIPDYEAGRLSDEDRDRVDAHAAECADCAAQFEVLEPIETPKSRLRDRLRQTLRNIPAPRDSRVVQVVLAAAVVFFLGLVGHLLSVMETRPVLTTADEGIVQAMSVAPTADLIPEVIDRRAIPREDIDEPAIFHPKARSSDHHEAAEDTRAMSGDSSDFLSYIKGEVKGYRGRTSGVYDTLGVGAGGGGGGRYGARFGGKENLVVAPFKPDDQLARFRQTDPKPEAKESLDARGGGTAAVQAPTPQEAPRMSRKVIRSGEMEFEIDSFDSAVGTLTKIAVEEQGFIATVNSEKLQNGKVRGTVVVRVPPDRLDTLLLKLRALGELRSQRIGSEDVTKHYFDLESRLRAARTMEERLIAIIKEGKGAIKDLLAAEKELGEWRTRIETMVGEINYYNNLIAHSTLTVTLAEKEIRAPFGLLETERVEMGLEVEDVEKAYSDALAAVTEAQGRVLRSELKQLGQGQFNAIVQVEVAPSRSGPLRDRFKQLGVLARLDIHRAQEAQGGSGRPQDAKVHQNDAQFLISIYNLVNVAPRETVLVNLACTDAERSYKAVLERVEKAAGRIQSSNLSRQKADQTIGRLAFQIRAADADAVLQDIRAAGEVMKLDVSEAQDTVNATRTKRGFQVNFFGLGTVLPRETSTVVLASKDVAAGYRRLAAAARQADARILAASLHENDRRNMTANLSFEIRREQEAAIADAAAQSGDVYTRSATRAQDADNVTDTKLLLHFRFFDASNIPARETVKLSVEVGDVDGVAKGLEGQHQGRMIDAKHTRDAGGRRETVLTIDVPLRDAAAAIERIKNLGSVLEHVGTRNPAVPDNDLALARLEVKLSNDVLVGGDSGPIANIRRGLAISLQAGSWALMLIIIGLCFVGPLLAVIWAGTRLRRRFAPKPAAAVTPAA